MSISYWWAWSHCQNVCCPNLAFILAWRFLCRCTLYHYLPCLSFFWLPEQKESLIQVDHSDQQQLRKSYGSVVFFSVKLFVIALFVMLSLCTCSELTSATCKPSGFGTYRVEQTVSGQSKHFMSASSSTPLRTNQVLLIFLSFLSSIPEMQNVYDPKPLLINTYRSCCKSCAIQLLIWL